MSNYGFTPAELVVLRRFARAQLDKLRNPNHAARSLRKITEPDGNRLPHESECCPTPDEFDDILCRDPDVELDEFGRMVVRRGEGGAEIVRVRRGR